MKKKQVKSIKAWGLKTVRGKLWAESFRTMKEAETYWQAWFFKKNLKIIRVEIRETAK